MDLFYLRIHDCTGEMDTFDDCLYCINLSTRKEAAAHVYSMSNGNAKAIAPDIHVPMRLHSNAHSGYERHDLCAGIPGVLNLDKARAVDP